MGREAESEPEADPALIYGNGLYNPYTYSSVYSPYTYGSYIKPAVYGSYGYRIFKRRLRLSPRPIPPSSTALVSTVPTPTPVCTAHTPMALMAATSSLLSMVAMDTDVSSRGRPSLSLRLILL